MGYALEDATSTQVVAAYAAPSASVESYETGDPPGWLVVGGFYLPLDVELARLDLIGFVSDDSLTLQARLFDMTTVSEVNGSRVSITDATPKRALSGAVMLTGNRMYQIHLRCFGGSAAGDFGSMQTATITD